MENFYWPVVIFFSIILLFLAALIIKSRQREEHSRVKPSHLRPNTEIKNDILQNTELKRKKLVAILIGFLVAGFIVFLVYGKKGSSSGDSDSLASMIPIWVAVFVPVLAANKQKKADIKLSEKQKRIRLYFLVGIMFFIMILVSLLIFSDN